MRNAAKLGWAVVTGASSGIGEALAEELAADGYHIVLVARDAQRLEACAAKLAALHGVRSLVVICDLAEPGACDKVKTIVQQAGIEVEVLVNNAGFGIHGPYEACNIQHSVELIEVQVSALMKLTHFFLGPMTLARRGYILNVASVYSLFPVPGQAVYSACKAFMLAFSRALSAELKGTGVSLSIVCPGVTKTRFRARMGYSESGRMKGMDADDVARVAVAGLFAGRFLVVPGLSNKLFAWTSRLLPQGLTVDMVQKVNHWRGLRVERQLKTLSESDGNQI